MRLNLYFFWATRCPTIGHIPFPYCNVSGSDMLCRDNGTELSEAGLAELDWLQASISIMLQTCGIYGLPTPLR
jgi:hypothetical protein